MSHLVSARKVMLEPSIFWSAAQAFMTAPSFTQYTSTSSIPAALRASWPLRSPGTWHVDHVGVKAPGRLTRMVFLPFRRSGMFTFSGGKPWSTETLGKALPTAIAMLLALEDSGLASFRTHSFFVCAKIPRVLRIGIPRQQNRMIHRSLIEADSRI